MRRERLLGAIAASVSSGHPVIGAGTGTGLAAKAAASGGADFICIYCTSRARQRGLPTSIIGDPNEITLELLAEVAFVVKETPLVAGIHATDPTRHVGELLETFTAMGCSGVINYPSMGLYGREYVGGPVTYEDGLAIEHEALELARSMDLVAMTYVYRPEEAAYFAHAADVIIAHAGWTAGGMVGAPDRLDPVGAAAILTDQIEAAVAAGSKATFLGHGGPFSGPDDTRELYDLTDVVGFVGASSVERIPVERAIQQVVKDFKRIPLRGAEG